MVGDCSMRTESLCCSKSFFSFVVKLFSNVTNVFHIYRLCCKLNDNASRNNYLSTDIIEENIIIREILIGILIKRNYEFFYFRINFAKCLANYLGA